MKKKFYLIIVPILLMFFGCQNSNLFSSKDSGTECTYEENTFTSLDELSEYIVKNNDKKFKQFFESNSKKSNSSASTLYTMKNVPNGYELSKIRLHGDFISYDYLSKSAMDSEKSNEQNQKSKVTFVWRYTYDGGTYLKNAIVPFGLTEMPDMPNFYYSEATDDYGVNIYQIYWEEDDYCFQLNIPLTLFNNSKSLKKADFVKTEKNVF